MIQSFLLNLTQTDLLKHLLPNNEINVLGHVHQILEIPHTAQELLSGELTLSLSMALPLYEDLLKKWKDLQVTLPKLQHYINVGISKLEEYIRKACKTRIYTHTMGVRFFLIFISYLIWPHSSKSDDEVWLDQEKSTGRRLSKCLTVDDWLS